jgi:hypothetical protein
MKRIWIYIAFVVLLVCGCSRDRDEKEVVKVKTVPLSLSAKKEDIITKASLSILPPGISTGIYVTAKDAVINTAFFENKNYVTQASGILFSTVNVDLTIGKDYDIYSYSPYQSTIGNPLMIEYTHGTDVLWAPKYVLTGVSATNNTATLTFEHRATQISFQVVFANDYIAGSKDFTASSSIQVTGFNSSGLLNIVTGILVPSGSPISTLSGAGTTGATTLGIGDTCIIASTGEMILAVQVTHNGKIYNGTIKETFIAGTSYNYTVTIRGYGSTLGLTGVQKEWNVISENIIIQS